MASNPFRAFPLRAEDIALAIANLVAVPVLAALGGERPVDGRAPLLGLVELLAVLGAIAALATRAADARPSRWRVSTAGCSRGRCSARSG